MSGNADIGGGLYLAPTLYDVVNTPGTAAEVDALERVVRCHVSTSKPRWIEPACGTGRYLRVLRRRGHEVAGYDPLDGMLDYARRGLKRWSRGWHLARASFTTAEVSLRPGQVAFCPVNSLRHLHDDASMLAHLDQMRSLLLPGGIYVVGLDLHHPHVFPDEDVWTGARGRLQVQQVVQYLPPSESSRREQVVVQMMVTRPRGAEHHGWSYDLRTYDIGQWSTLVAAAGWGRVATYDGAGHPTDPAAVLPYQLEVLAPA